MKKLLVIVTILISINSQALFLNYCMNTGNQYSSSFGFCINDNFRSIEREIDELIYLSNCDNYMSDGISSSFEFCINQNFRSIERALDYKLFLSYCYNSDQDLVDYFFVSCVNNNFRSIEREIDK